MFRWKSNVFLQLIDSVFILLVIYDFILTHLHNCLQKWSWNRFLKRLITHFFLFSNKACNFTSIISSSSKTDCAFDKRDCNNGFGAKVGALRKYHCWLRRNTGKYLFTTVFSVPSMVDTVIMNSSGSRTIYLFLTLYAFFTFHREYLVLFNSPLTQSWIVVSLKHNSVVAQYRICLNYDSCQ